MATRCACMPRRATAAEAARRHSARAAGERAQAGGERVYAGGSVRAAAEWRLDGCECR